MAKNLIELPYLQKMSNFQVLATRLLTRKTIIT